MKVRNTVVSIFALLLCLSAQTALAQNNNIMVPSQAQNHNITVPPLVKFSGAIADAQGTVGVTFSLYKDQTGGAPLWLETQNVALSATGTYTVFLGVNHQEGVPSELFANGQAYWLGVQVHGQAEQPRVLLATVPYAMKAVDADTLGGRPASSFLSSTSTPAENAAFVQNVVKQMQASGVLNPPNPTFPPSSFSGSNNTQIVSITQKGRGAGLTSTATSGIAGVFASTSGEIASFRSGSAEKVSISNAGNITAAGAITATGGVTAATFTGSGSGLTGVNADDLGGAAASAFPQLATANSWTNANIFGAGAADATTFLSVSADQASYVIAGTNYDTANASAGVVGIGSSFGYGVYGDDDAAGGTGVWGQSAGGVGVVGMAAGEAGVSGYTTSTDPTTGGVVATDATDGGNGVVATCVGYLCNGIMVQAFEDASSATGGNTAISAAGDNGGVFFANGGGNGGNGVYGEADNVGYAGIFGAASQTVGTGVLGEATVASVFASEFVGAYPIAVAGTTGALDPASGNAGIGVFGASDQGWAAYFLNNNSNPSMYAENDNGVNAVSPILYSYDGTAGNYCYTDTTGSLTCNGTVTDSNGTLVKIDHPSDPANKYLVHASIQSSEMKNLYDGKVTTDGEGLAVVRMPEWFEALNADFRYQLTVMGQFAQAIVAKQIANGEFTIRTDKPNVEVCWQVTAVRNDAWAKAHPLQVELNKSAAERGHYVNPALYGASKELSMAQVHHAGAGVQPTERSARALKHPQVKAVKLAAPVRLPLRHMGPNPIRKPATRQVAGKQ